AGAAIHGTAAHRDSSSRLAIAAVAKTGTRHPGPRDCRPPQPYLRGILVIVRGNLNATTSEASMNRKGLGRTAAQHPASQQRSRRGSASIAAALWLLLLSC